MTISCKLELRYDDPGTAERVAKSVSPDNEDYIEVKIDGGKLLCRADAESPLQLLHTLDDFLACVTVAEETLKENRDG